MKKVKKYALCLLVLTGCSGQKAHEAENQSGYNQYLRTSFVALTDHNAVISDAGRLYYTDYDSVKEPAFLCYDPSCNHRDADCASYFPGDMIFGSAEYLYYPVMDDESYGFYRMTSQGTEREKIFSFPYSESANVGYMVQFHDPYVSVLAAADELNEGRQSVLIRNVNDQSDEWKCIFGEEGNRSYTSVFFHDGWYFASYMAADSKLGLEAYRLSDGKRVDITENWDLLSASDIAVTDDHFIWTVQEDGFYTKGFDDQEAVMTAPLEKIIDQSQTFADDEFFYLVNTSKYVDDMLEIPVPEEERGLKIYDRQGNLLVKLTSAELGFRPSYLWSEENRIVFANTDQSFSFPYFYISRDDIHNKKAEIHLISE